MEPGQGALAAPRHLWPFWLQDPMKKDSYSSVFRIKKLHTDGDLLGAGSHNLRDRQPINADQDRAHFNQVVIGQGRTPLELVQTRINELGIKVHASNVRAIECILSAGKPFFEKSDLGQWIKDSLAFVEEKFGKGSVVHATLHMDENTPHLHPILVPVRRANDQDGLSYVNHKKRDWKLASTEILHSMANLRTIGPRRTNDNPFVETDITNIKELAKKLVNHTDSPSKFLWKKLKPETQTILTNCARKTRRNKAALRALIPELKRIIEEDNIDMPNRFLSVKISPEVEALRIKNAGKGKSISLNRMLIEDTFKDEISTRRPIGKESAPFLHQCQVDYYDLCKKYDPEISAPKYKTKLDHNQLTQWNGMLAEAVDKNISSLKIEFAPPSPLQRLAPQTYIADQIAKITSKAEHDLELITAKAAAYELTIQENERLQQGIRNANAEHEREVQALKSKISELEHQNKAYANKLRAIPLASVIEKLGYPVQVKAGKTLVNLPADRVLEVTSQGFTELTNFGGRGSMKGRHKGKGAIDLTIWITGWDIQSVRKWLGEEAVRDDDAKKEQAALVHGLDLAPLAEEILGTPAVEQDGKFVFTDDNYSLTIEGRKFSDAKNPAIKGSGAIDLVSKLTGRNDKGAVEYLLSKCKVAEIVADEAGKLAQAKTAELEPLQPRILTLDDIPKQIWMPRHDHWSELRKRLVDAQQFNGTLIDNLREQEMIWAVDGKTLAVSRTAVQDESRRVGITLVPCDSPDVSPRILAPDQEGFFWLGASLAKTNRIVAVSNPLEAFAYRHLFLLHRKIESENQTVESKSVEAPHIISLDQHVPPSFLLQRIVQAKKKLVLATHAPEPATRLCNQFGAQVGQPGQFLDWLEIEELDPKPAPQAAGRAWCNTYIEKLKEFKELERIKILTRAKPRFIGDS